MKLKLLAPRSLLRSLVRAADREGAHRPLLCRSSSCLQGPTSYRSIRSLSNSSSAAAGSALGTHKVDYDFENLVEMQIKSCEIHKDEKFLGTLDSRQGAYQYINFAEFGEQVKKFRGVLSVHNIGVDDKVCDEIIFFLSSLLVRLL